MSTGEQYDYNDIADAVRKARGKITLAAQAIGCTRQTIYSFAKKYATVQNAIDEARGTFDEELLDIAEHKLRSAVLEGEAWAIKYALDKKGYGRGYRDTQRTEHTGADGGAIQHNLTWEQLIKRDDTGD